MTQSDLWRKIARVSDGSEATTELRDGLRIIRSTRARATLDALARALSMTNASSSRRESLQQLDIADAARQHTRVPDPFRIGWIEIDAADVGLGGHERVFGPDTGRRIETPKLVDVVQGRPDQVIL